MMLIFVLICCGWKDVVHTFATLLLHFSHFFKERLYFLFMSSNITVIRVCEHCGNEFTARTTVTRFCGDVCRKRDYKQREREKKVLQSDKQTATVKATKIKFVKDVSKLEYLNPTDASKLLMCSVRNVYKLLDVGKLPYAQFSEKKRLIKRSDIDSYLSSLNAIQQREKVQSIEKPFDLANSFTMGEAQQYYNISEKGLYELIKKHNIRKHRNGKYVFVEQKELNKLLTK